MSPEFHQPDTLTYHGLSILRDLGADARTFSVSQATADDLTAYVAMPADRITVCRPGADPPPEIDRYWKSAGPRTHASLRRRLGHESRRARTSIWYEIAARVTGRFGAETAVGFLFYEILGRSPDSEDLLGFAERLHRTPSTVWIMVEELLALASSQQ